MRATGNCLKIQLHSIGAVLIHHNVLTVQKRLHCFRTKIFNRQKNKKVSQTSRNSGFCETTEEQRYLQEEGEEQCKQEA